jgi:chemotaxis protein methyltransferase CheR
MSEVMTTPPRTPIAGRTVGATGATRQARPAGSDYDRFCAGIKSLTGIELTHYRQGQMERRLRTFAERQGCADLDVYLVELRKDKETLEGFLDRMTINVSELFRNPERFEELEKTHLPALLKASPAGLRIWSAGCSYGAEPYTLSVILQEIAPGKRHEIIASDLDQVILAKARRGRFTEGDVRHVPPARLAKWFVKEEDAGTTVYEANAKLKALVTFRHHNLLEDRFPDKLDLIACRNVVIYFKDDAKAAIYERFLQALRPGGLLFVGSTERVHRAEEMGWQRASTFFYRKPG